MTPESYWQRDGIRMARYPHRHAARFAIAAAVEHNLFRLHTGFHQFDEADDLEPVANSEEVLVCAWPRVVVNEDSTGVRLPNNPVEAVNQHQRQLQYWRNYYHRKKAAKAVGTNQAKRDARAKAEIALLEQKEASLKVDVERLEQEIAALEHEHRMRIGGWL